MRRHNTSRKEVGPREVKAAQPTLIIFSGWNYLELSNVLGGEGVGGDPGTFFLGRTLFTYLSLDEELIQAATC